MRNAEYWRGRFSMLEETAFKESEQTVQQLERLYMDAQQSVQKEIEAWYGRFAANNQISLADARKLLTTGQLEEFRWTVDQYIQAGQKAGVDPTWLKRLENASARVHISRLESLQLQIQQQVELLNGNQLDSIDTLLKKVVGGNYTHAAYEIQKGLGLGWDLTGLNQHKLETLLSKPWTTDGRTFRDRCWLNKTELVTTVNREMVQGMLRGDPPEKAIQAIQKQFGVSKYKARRLVHTETSYFNAQSTKEAYKDLGIDQVEILETLDNRTCDVCGGLDGKVIPMSEYEPGVTVPPFHPNCRGTTCPHYDDLDGERAARNAEGKVYYVPADMKYTDWKAAFVDGGAKAGLTAVVTSAKMEPSEVRKQLQSAKVEYRKVGKLNHPLTDDEIIMRLGGGDKTKGSCSSLGFAYAGNHSGLDVLDFRGGISQDFFSRTKNIKAIANLPGVISQIESSTNDIKAATVLLKSMAEDKLYYLATGRHAAIVRKIAGGGYEYLELQSATQNGFKPLTTDALKHRFRCQKTHSTLGMPFSCDNVLIDVDSLAGNQEFEEILGYINTAVDQQLKGVSGNVK